jgi:hypothetical protein
VIRKAPNDLDGASFSVQEAIAPATAVVLKVPALNSGVYRFVVQDSTSGLVYPSGTLAAQDTSFFIVDNNQPTRRLNVIATAIPNDTTYAVAFPAGGTAVLANATQTLAGKTIALGSNTVSGTKAQLNTAVTDDNVAFLGSANQFSMAQTLDAGLSVSSGTGFYASLNTANLSTDREYRPPNAAGTLVLNDNAAPLDNKTIRVTNAIKAADNTFRVVDEGDTTKTVAWSLGGATAGADLTIAWSGAADRTLTMPITTTTLAGLGVTQTFTGVNTFGDVNVVGALALEGPTNAASIDNSGDAASVSTLPTDDGVLTTSVNRLNLTAQSAGISATALNDVAGLYAIHYEMTCTTADVTAGSITFDVIATGDGGAQTVSSASLPLTTAAISATNPVRGTIVRYLASGNLQYSVTVTGAVNAARYALRARVVLAE